jgi:hypothetical protein
MPFSVARLKKEVMGILLFAIFYILIIPMCVLLHEVGHGLGVVLSSGARASIYLGKFNEKENKKNFHIGRLDFHIQWSYFGCCYSAGDLKKNQELAFFIGGPLMSLILSLISFWLWSTTSDGVFHSLFQGITMFSITQFLITAIPIKYPKWMGSYSGFSSDGLQLLKILKSK